MNDGEIRRVLELDYENALDADAWTEQKKKKELEEKEMEREKLLREETGIKYIPVKEIDYVKVWLIITCIVEMNAIIILSVVLWLKK